MKNKTKLAIATTLLVGGIVIACGTSEDKHVESNSKSIKKEIAQSSIPELESKIIECDTALSTLQKIIDSPDSNPEERFQARRAFKSISERRDGLQKELDTLQKDKTTTINFHDGIKSR